MKRTNKQWYRKLIESNKGIIKAVLFGKMRHAWNSSYSFFFSSLVCMTWLCVLVCAHKKAYYGMVTPITFAPSKKTTIWIWSRCTCTYFMSYFLLDIFCQHWLWHQSHFHVWTNNKFCVYRDGNDIQNKITTLITTATKKRSVQSRWLENVCTQRYWSLCEMSNVDVGGRRKLCLLFWLATHQHESSVMSVRCHR